MRLLAFTVSPLILLGQLSSCRTTTSTLTCSLALVPAQVSDSRQGCDQRRHCSLQIETSEASELDINMRLEAWKGATSWNLGRPEQWPHVIWPQAFECLLPGKRHVEAALLRISVRERSLCCPSSYSYITNASGLAVAVAFVVVAPVHVHSWLVSPRDQFCRYIS